MMKIKFRSLFIVFSVLSVLIFNDSVVMADGLEPEEAMISTKPLLATPPPVVEGVSELFLPPDAEPPVVEAPSQPSPPPKENLWPRISQGMILLKLAPEGAIRASEDQKQLLGQGDLVYLSSNDAPFSANEEWVVFKEIKDVYHPKTGVRLGKLVYVLGMVESIDADDKVATARIIRSKEPIRIGDSIASIKRFLPQTPEKGLPPEKGDEALIVEVRDDRTNVAQHDIVYINYGKEDGVSRGDAFIVVHAGVRDTSFSNKNPRHNDLPLRRIGTMVVLATQAHTATAKITRSIEPIEKGDTILFDSPK